MDLDQQYSRARATIDCLTANMVKPEVANSMYYEKFREVTTENVLKLLIRAKKLYESRNDATKILKQVIEIDRTMRVGSLVWRILENDGAELT